MRIVHVRFESASEWDISARKLSDSYSEFVGRHSEAVEAEKIPPSDEVVDPAAGSHRELPAGMLSVRIASSTVTEAEAEKIEAERRAQFTVAVAWVAHTTATEPDLITVASIECNVVSVIIYAML